MSKKRYGPYSLTMAIIVMTSLVTPTFAEVTDLQTDSESYFKGDTITFSGKVEPYSSGLVTIVIRDANDEFVMLAQAITDENYTFEKTVKINEKFTQHGVYNATGFILNMTAGVTANFGVSTNGVPITSEEEIADNEILPQTPIQEEAIEPADETVIEPEESNEEQIIEETVSKTKEVDFVDPTKGPQYYLDRYYNEPAYKSWFDRNYPGMTIEEAVGVDLESMEPTTSTVVETELIPVAQATSIGQPAKQSQNNSETAQLVLAVGGLGILFGAVYGIKKKADNNSKQISINKDIIRKKIINPLMGSSPEQILQIRLAKGEITLEEYEELERKLKL